LSSQVGIAPIAGAFIIVAAAVLIAGPARAHDWYEGVTNAQGERCCGGKECARLEDGDVKEIPGGFLIQSIGVTIPYAATQSSRDGHFHACVWWTPQRQVKCFFAPMPAS
jgi:hypothetical protein